MAPKQKYPYKREGQAASKLEVSMLEYQLKEAQDKAAKKQEELNRVSDILENTTKIADQRAEKVTYLTSLTTTLTKRLVRWKAAAIIEFVVFITYFILQGV